MSEDTLLVRCRQTIETLNEVILAHKKDIDRLETHNRNLKAELELSESSRLSLMEELSKFKRKVTHEKADKLTELHKLESLLIDANTEVENNRLTKESLEKRIGHCQKEMAQRNLNWEDQIAKLRERLSVVEKENHRLDQDKSSLYEDTKVYQREVQELKKECEALNQQLQEVKGGQSKGMNQLQKELIQCQSQNNEYLRSLSYLSEEKDNLIHLIDKQKKAIEEYKEMLDKMHYASRSVHTEPAESLHKTSLSAKKKGRTFEKLQKVERSIRRAMQELY